MKEKKAIYFTKLSLTNVRCFKKKSMFSFTDEEGKYHRWNLILGNNGTGKTTVLRSLFFAIAGKWRFMINWDYFKRSSDKSADIGVELMPYKYAVKLDPIAEEHSINYSGSMSSKYGVSINVPCFGYGASRMMGGKTLSTEKNTFDADSLFNDDATLINAEEWLLQTHLAEHLSRSKASLKKTKKSQKDKVISILLKLLKGKVSEIKLEAVNKVPKVLLKTHSGWVGVHDLSMGYKTLIAWMVDLASRLFDEYPDSENPLEEPAIVLIDEIDLHLHPSFQRALVKFLLDTFTQTQFIVTAHSPLIVQASENANIILLEKNGDAIQVHQNPINVDHWRVDQILTSELFDLESSRSIKVENLIKEKSILLNNNDISERERERLLEIDEILDGLPTGSNRVEMEAMEIIKKAANYLKDKPL